MQVVASMMARGEGTTLKRKNAYRIAGKPMLQWALEAAKEAGFIDHIFVWTEDTELSEITERCGGIVIPRTRDQLSYHAGFSNPLDWKGEREKFILEKIGTLGDIRVSLNCNFCVMTGEILYAMFAKLIEDPQAGEIVPVCKVDPYLFTVNPNNQHLFPVFHQFGLDRQHYPPLFRAGGITIDHTVRKQNRVSLLTAYHEVEKKYLLDVHDEEDAELAEFYLLKRPCKTWVAGPFKCFPLAYAPGSIIPGGIY